MLDYRRVFQCFTIQGVYSNKNAGCHQTTTLELGNLQATELVFTMKVVLQKWPEEKDQQKSRGVGKTGNREGDVIAR